MKIRNITMIISTIFLLLWFQNCSSPIKLSSSLATSISNGAQTVLPTSGSGGQPYDGMGGGQPYDGLTYITKGQCPDGTVVTSRLMVDNSVTTLLRENCQTITPQVINPSLVQITLGVQVVYSGQIYLPEFPVIPLQSSATWFMQLTGNLVINQSQFYFVDMFGTTASTISSLISQGHVVICVISAGTVENWDPDASAFQTADIGNAEQGASGENWLDTRSANVRSIMLTRMNLAKSKGCQGMDVDAVDGYENNSGFPLTEAAQVAYNEFLAFSVHDRAMLVSMNGSADLASQMAPIYDLAAAEQCFTYSECGGYASFVSLSKPVMAIEYGAVQQSFCAQAQSQKITLEFFNQNLDGTGFYTCP